MRGCGSELRRAGRRQVKAASLVLVFLLVVMIPVTTAPAQEAWSVPRQNSDHGAARERSPPVVSYWAKTYGGIYADSANSVQETSDGGYVVAGYTTSFGAGSVDFWVLKLNSTGGVTWQKTYGVFSSGGYAYSVQQTSDGGYIVAGEANPFGASGNWGVWVLKLNSTGSVEWQKTYGGSSSDVVHSVRQTAEGGYIIAGYTYSFGAGGSDFWVLKLNSTGSVEWQKTYGGSSLEWAESVQQTADGGYIVAGSTSFGAGNYDFWILKLNSTGGVTWQKTYGGGSEDYAYSVQQTSDGGYIVTGETNSFGAGDLVYGYGDVWVLKLNSTGSVTWQKTYGGSGIDVAHSVQQIGEGGYLVAGYTYSFGAGGSDFWVLRLNSTGGVTWQKTYGGSSDDHAYSVRRTSDGGCVVAGETWSFGAGDVDAWVVKLGAGGDIVWDAGSNASTQTTSAIPSDSSAAVSTTSVTPADSAATVQNTQVTALDSNATVTVQSSGGLAGQEILLITIVGSLIAVAVVVLVLAALVLINKKKAQPRLCKTGSPGPTDLGLS